MTQPRIVADLHLSIPEESKLYVQPIELQISGVGGVLVLAPTDGCIILTIVSCADFEGMQLTLV